MALIGPVPVFCFEWPMYRRSALLENREREYDFLEQGGSMLFEPRHEKTGLLHMRKQRRRSTS